MSHARVLASLLSVTAILSFAACTEDVSGPERTGRAVATIIGGVKDNDAQAHESVVFLYASQAGGACTGSLIAPNLVLTARHCVSINVTQGIGCDIDGKSSNGDHVGADYSAGSFEIYTGYSPGGAPVATGKKLFHPDTKNLCNNDIALLLLKNAVPGAKPMPLRLDFGPAIGELTMAIGYGKTTKSDASSGLRYRRADIPVLSNGRDWNYLNGANEFVMGQSTCQGDSGGPILAMASSAILGVTSRGGDCFTGEQHFTKVAAHKDLILAAFAEAAASPVAEGLAPPPDPGLGSTGQDACVTGAECKKALCYKGLCSDLCQPGSCPSGTYCAPTSLDLAGQTIDASVCSVPAAGSTDCASCHYTRCKGSMEPCLTDPVCAGFLPCVDKCTDKDCFDACEAANPAGAAAYQKVHACECGVQCDTDCKSICPVGTGGAGGAGGSAGTGGGAGSAGASGGAAGSTGGTAGAGGASAGAGGVAAAGTGGAASATSGPAGQGGSSAGAGGTASAGATAAPAGDAAESSDSGGCSTRPGPRSPNGAVALLALAGALALVRRRRVS